MDGIFDRDHRFELSRIDTRNLAEIFYHWKYNDNGRSYYDGSECCAEAAQNPRAVAWYHKPYSGCSIYLGDQCPNKNVTLNGGHKETVDVYYDATPGYEDDSYGSVGGGQCGELSFVDLWE